MKSIFKILKELHSRNYFHLDMKLPNLVYNVDTDQIQIIDFGTSKHWEGKKLSLNAASLICMPLFMKKHVDN